MKHLMIDLMLRVVYNITWVKNKLPLFSWREQKSTLTIVKFCVRGCYSALSSCHWTTSDANYWRIGAFFIAMTTTWFEEFALD